MNVLVTGASRGMGKAIAEIFAAHGHHLFITARNEVALYKTMEELLVKYPSITIKAKAFDLSKKRRSKRFWKMVFGNFGAGYFNKQCRHI